MNRCTATIALILVGGLAGCVWDAPPELPTALRLGGSEPLRRAGLGHLATPAGPSPFRIGATTVGPDHAAVAADYAAGRGHVEQRYRLRERPAGAGPTVVWTKLGVATHDRRGTLWTDPMQGQALSVSDARVWDADRRRLPSKLVAANDGFGLQIDDRDARYPLTIDPYVSVVPLWDVVGADDHEGAGIAVALGDFDGDGLDDAAVGIAGHDTTEPGVGAVELQYGSGQIGMLVGTETESWLGHALAVADVDEDGYDDLFVGAPGDGSDLPGRGSVRLHLGSVAGVSATPARIWSEGSPLSAFGSTITWLGDIDADGVGEFAVAAIHDGPFNQGFVRVLASDAVEPPELTLAGDGPGELYGHAMAAREDVTGDGIADLVVAAPSGTGRVEVIPGGAVGLALTQQFDVASAGQQFGYSLAVGDFNDDGTADLAVGAPETSGDKGSVYVFLDGDFTAPAFTMSGFGNNRLGVALAVGDVDLDGIVDLAAGAPGAPVGTSALAGRVQVYIGGALVDAVTVPGPVPEGRMGSALTMGDMNGDGRAEILAGGFLSPGPGVKAGAAWLFEGVLATVDVDADGHCLIGAVCPSYLLADDCDDLNPLTYQGAAEQCDGEDNNCDGVVPPDEIDTDGDGWVGCAGDCLEGDATSFPGAQEQCDPIDHDCDGAPENDVLPQPRWLDADGDGVGAGPVVALSCDPVPLGQSDVFGDCDDLRATVSPALPETTCNGVDNDCDPLTEDAPDADGDGYTACPSCAALPPEARCGDCDDAERLVHPNLSEVCGDEVDQDCLAGDAPCEEFDPCLEPDNICEEPGCNSAGGAALPAGMLVWLLAMVMLRRRPSLALVPLLLAGTASAQGWDAEGRLDTQLLRPSFAPSSFLGSSGTDPGLAGSFGFGVATHYELAPMVLYFDESEVERIVRHRVTHTLGAWVAPLDRLGFGVSLPLVFQDARWDEGDWSLTPASPGDLEVDTLIKVLSGAPGAVSVGMRVWFPTARKHSLAGEAVPRFEARAAARGAIGPVEGLLELRGLVRQPLSTGYDLRMGPQLALLVGARVWAVPSRLAVLLEFDSRASVVEFLQPGGANPADVRLGLRIQPVPQVHLQIAAGLGVNRGYGTARVRALAAVTVRPVRAPKAPPLEREPPPEDVPVEEVSFDDLDDLDELDVPPPEPEPEPPPVPEPEAPLAELVEEQIVIRAPIEFDYDSDRLLDVSLPVLHEVKRVMKEHPELGHVLIEGHASLEGRTTYNWDLSNRRAAAVFRWLVENGVSSQRLSSRGMGEAVPRTETTSAVVEGDRRVEFHIVERLDPLLDEIPNWEAEAPPIPWLMEEREPDPEPTTEDGGER